MNSHKRVGESLRTAFASACEGPAGRVTDARKAKLAEYSGGLFGSVQGLVEDGDLSVTDLVLVLVGTAALVWDALRGSPPVDNETA